MYAILRRAIAPEWASIHCARQRVFSTTPVSLSHIGSEPIALPDSVSCDIQAQDPAGIQHVRISGPLGAAQLELPKDVLASIQPSLRDSPSQPATIQVECRDARDSSARSSWGLARTKLHNAVQGVTTGFRLPVRLVGVGYRANLETKEMDERALSAHHSLPRHGSPITLSLRLGYPRPVRLPIPSGIVCEILSPTEMLLKGSDKELLGGFAASIRRWRPPEPYNGKGVFVGTETVRRKEVRKK